MPSIIIVGSGPAGISAALYAVRAGVDTTVLTKGPGALDRAEKLKTTTALPSRFPVRSWNAAAWKTPDVWACSSSRPKRWA